MTAILIYLGWLKCQAHRRRLVEQFARRFTSRKLARRIAWWIP